MGLPARFRHLRATARRRLAALAGRLRRRRASEARVEDAAAVEPGEVAPDEARAAWPRRVVAALRHLPQVALAHPRRMAAVAALAALALGVWGTSAFRERGTAAREAVRAVLAVQRLGVQLQALRRHERDLLEPRVADSASKAAAEGGEDRWLAAVDRAHELAVQLGRVDGLGRAGGELPVLLAGYVAAVNDARPRTGRAPMASARLRAAVGATAAALEDGAAEAGHRASAARRAAQRDEDAAITTGVYALAGAAVLVLFVGIGLGAGHNGAQPGHRPGGEAGEAGAAGEGGAAGEDHGSHAAHHEPTAPADASAGTAPAAAAPPAGPPALGDQHERLLRRALDHLEVGIVTIDAERTLVGGRAVIADRWFGVPRDGATLDGWLGDTAPEFVAALRASWDALVDATGPARAAAVARLPGRFAHGGHVWQVVYTILDDNGPEVEGAIVCFTDVTATVAAQRLGHAHSELLGLVERFNLDRRGAAAFADELAERAVAVRTSDSPSLLESNVRTLREDLAIYGVASAATMCQELEEILRTEGDLSADERRLLVGRIDEVVVQLRALAGERHGAASVVLDADLGELAQLVSLEMPHAELATAVSRLRYEPVARLLAPAAESARQILSTPGRAPVDLAIKDHGLRVDGARWRPFFAALVHVARHQATGAGETEEERLSGCKEPRLAFSLEVVLDDAEVVVRVADDGPGLATEVIRAAGRRAGRATGSPDNLVDAAFTETSGRPGVGLAAARQECLELGGAVEVTTSAGEGTTITFRFPADGAGVLAAA